MIVLQSASPVETTMARARPSQSPAFPADVRTIDVPLSVEEPVRVQRSARRADRVPHYDVHDACEVGVVTKGCYRRFYEGVTRDVPAGQIWVCGVWEPHGAQTIRTPTESIQLMFHLKCLLTEGIAAVPWQRLFLNSAPHNRRIVLDRNESRCVLDAALE